MANVMSTTKLAELLTTSEPYKSMCIRILNNQLVLGADPFQPNYVIDFSDESIRPYSSENLAQNVSLSAPPVREHYNIQTKGSRRSGKYWFEINNRREECGSLKELLAAGLRAIEHTRPGTLEKLSHIKPRSKRIVARDPKQLFEKDHLVKPYSEPLDGEWWYGTNNSDPETSSWLERACSLAELKWNVDFKTSLTTSLTLSDF
ncbi:MAG: hypothetical protein K2P94_05870 [Rhodospirillaceae bacterium]|nr:hypothetical protein [Rhodospirillaceae bacterium]